MKTQSLRKSLENNRLGVIDCGGSKVSLAVFDTSTTPPTVLSNHSLKTQLGKDPLLSQLSTLINHHSISHDTKCWVIGFPGNIKNGIIQPGSANNLSKTNGEFDNCHIAESLLKNIEGDVTIRVINDALLQIQGIIYNCELSIIDELGYSPFMYIGPGTGLGGALAKISNINSRKLRFIGDGHIYDILLYLDHKESMAEDIISGRALVERTGISGKKANENKIVLEKIKPTLKKMGLALAQLIIQINNGNVAKKYPFNKWPQSVQEEAQKVTTFFIGGGLLNQHSVGNIIFDSMEEQIKKYNENNNINLNVIRPKLSSLTILTGGLLELFD